MEKLGVAGSAMLQQSVDELDKLHLRMRTDADRIGVILKKANHIGYSRRTMDALNDLHYDRTSKVYTEAKKHIASRMHDPNEVTKPTTETIALPGMKPTSPVKLPGM